MVEKRQVVCLVVLAWQPVDPRSDPDEPEHRGDPAVLLDAAGALLQLVARPQWQERAACRGVGVDVFFVGLGQSTAPAKALCDRCEVFSYCHAYALPRRDLDGIWRRAQSPWPPSTAPRDRSRVVVLSGEER